MKTAILITTFLLAFVSVQSVSAQTKSESNDEKTIRMIPETLQEAWNNADADKWAALFSENADYTVWNGFHVDGRAAIADGHRRIWSTIYKGTKVHFMLKKLEFLKPDLVVMRMSAALSKEGVQIKDAPETTPLAIVQKIDGKWQITYFQNTPILADK
ncbi:MAG: SgcJ/EcaC family oxidoreductase [Pyrinomonadaceae bacterium]